LEDLRWHNLIFGGFEMAQFDFGGVMEEVITSEEFSLQKARELLQDETVAVLGYGVQGPGQALNMRDNGIRVIVGQREGGSSWDRAVADGFVPGARGRIILGSRRGRWVCPG
jgi:ketol-acid reductoisomerase